MRKILPLCTLTFQTLSRVNPVCVIKGPSDADVCAVVSVPDIDSENTVYALPQPRRQRGCADQVSPTMSSHMGLVSVLLLILCVPDLLSLPLMGLLANRIRALPAGGTDMRGSRSIVSRETEEPPADTR